MGKSALFFVTALLLSRAEFPASAQAANPTPPPPAIGSTLRMTAPVDAPNRVVGYTAWDDDYFYIAFQINKPTLSAKNKEPFTHPLEDDAVILSLQIDNDHKSVKRTAKTVVLAVSGAGGAQLYLGESGRPLFESLDDLNKQMADINKTETDPTARQAKTGALLGSIPRFTVEPKGAQLPGGSAVPGYTVEAAIPWSDLGGKPDPGAKMGFHVAAQSRVPGSPALQALSPKVLSESDLYNPSLWGEIVFSNSPSPATGLLVSPRVFANKPIIDGALSGGEWNPLSSFEFGERMSAGGGASLLANTLAARARLPFAPRAPRALVPIAGPAISALPARQPQKAPPLVLARYIYWYQADSRKAAPMEHVRLSGGATALAHHPIDSLGPWFSYDRANWHRRQLMDARRAGIDVILPDYRGSARDRQLYANKGLAALTAALKSLRQTDQDYPLVALYLDTSSLIDIFGDRPDLHDPAVRTALANMIRDFYERIPAEFRYTVPLSQANGGGSACVVFLSDAGAFKAIDPGFEDMLRGRFAADFDGSDLVVLGENAFQGKAKLDGYFGLAGAKSAPFQGDGWIKVAGVSPGYDNTMLANAGEQPVVRSRKDGQTYRDDWTAALNRHPDWILLESWNDFSIGSELAPSIELGYSYADLTRVFTRMFSGAAPFSVKYLRNDVPSVMLAKSAYAVHVRAQNTGLSGWDTKAGNGMLATAFTARWRKAGQDVGAGTPVPLASVVLSGQDVDLAFTATAPFEPGDYTLEFTPAETGKRGASVSPDQTLVLPIKVRGADGLPVWNASLVQSDLPATLENGSVYDLHATLRNDGSAVWRKTDGARVTLRLYRTVLSDTAGNQAITEAPIQAADATAELTRDVLPGETADVSLKLPLMDSQGAPLPAWSQDELWTYVARWEVAANPPTSGPRAAAAGDADSVAAFGVSTAPTPISVVDFDFGVRFVSDGTLGKMPAQKRIPVRLSLQNVGAQIWKKDNVRVGYHWYYLDGTEFVWDDETTPLSQDVPPGGRVNDILVYVTAPPATGAYFLVWDVKVGDTWASTSAGTRALDQIVHEVDVIDGTLTFADLSKAFNVSGITDEDDLASGDFDGQGNTFPSAFIPPFANTNLVPSGIWLPTDKGGPDSQRRISFRWGPKGSKLPNFVACKGQRLNISKAGTMCRRLHIVAASTGKQTQGDIRLIFQEPTSQSEDIYPFAVSRWDSAPTQGEAVAFLSPRHHSRKGNEPGPVVLYHYVITVREPRKLAAIQLPDVPDIKIAAITMEK